MPRGRPLNVSLQVVQDTHRSTPATPCPPGPCPRLQEALDSDGITAGTVTTTAPDNYIVFAPTCFQITPPPRTEALPQGGERHGQSRRRGQVDRLLVLPRRGSVRHGPLELGDKTTEDVPAFSSGPPNCVTHYYKQISGNGNVPTGGPTVTANQDVVVTAFVGWIDENGAANYECVTQSGGLDGVNQQTQAQAMVACSTTYANALVDTKLPPSPSIRSGPSRWPEHARGLPRRPPHACEPHEARGPFTQSATGSAPPRAGVRRPRRRGQSTVEFSLVFGLFLLSLMAIVDSWIWTIETDAADAAVEQGIGVAMSAAGAATNTTPALTSVYASVLPLLKPPLLDTSVENWYAPTLAALRHEVGATRCPTADEVADYFQGLHSGYDGVGHVVVWPWDGAGHVTVAVTGYALSFVPPELGPFQLARLGSSRQRVGVGGSPGRTHHGGARRRRRGQDAQAAIEMAMVLPIMIVIVLGFVGMMLELRAENEFQTAVDLAAQALARPPAQRLRANQPERTMLSMPSRTPSTPTGARNSYLVVTKPVKCTGAYLDGRVDLQRQGFPEPVTCTAQAEPRVLPHPHQPGVEFWNLHLAGHGKDITVPVPPVPRT